MIKAENIIKSYGNSGNRFPVLQGICLEIQDGDFAVILGASGSGKSTLLNVLSGLERPDSGKVYYGKQEHASDKADDRNRFPSPAIEQGIEYAGRISPLFPTGS